MPFNLLKKLVIGTICVVTLTVASAQEPAEEEAALYPMFSTGDGRAPHHVDFFWTPSETSSSTMFHQIILPLLQRNDPSIDISLYMVAEPDTEDDLIDAQLGAILMCVPAEQVPAFALEILDHNKTDDDLRNTEELFEASKKFGNKKSAFFECLAPRLMAAIKVTSESVKQLAKIDSFPALLVDGIEFPEVESADQLIKLVTEVKQQ
jgi:hypothetical protein